MNILIITHFYEVDGVMGSVRWTSIAHRLAEHHNVVVVAHKGYEHSPRNSSIPVVYVNNECGYVKSSIKRRVRAEETATVHNRGRTDDSPKAKTPIVSLVKSTLSSFLYHLSMQSRAKINSRIILDKLDKMDFRPDWIISTSRPFIDCYDALYLVKKTGAKWMLDQRDLVHSDNATIRERLKTGERFVRLDKYVTCYTLISHGLKDDFLIDCKYQMSISEKTFVVNNGYNLNHSLGENVSPKVSSCISIAYAGDLYAGKRDARMLFDALRRLLDDYDQISEKDFSVEYAGNSARSLQIDAAQFNLESIVKDHGFVPHIQALKLQAESDILLLLTWNTATSHGVIPAKFYEYMAAGKPVICLTAGYEPNGEAGDMVSSMRLGISGSYLEYENDVVRLKDYLYIQWTAWKNGETLLYDPDMSAVGLYNYDALSEKIEQLLRET